MSVWSPTSWKLRPRRTGGCRKIARPGDAPGCRRSPLGLRARAHSGRPTGACSCPQCPAGGAQR
eukprot:595803-Prorocentrum_minimum.AAC.3